MNQLKKKLFLVAAAVLLLGASASAQTTYTVTTTPTFVINTGRSEALGSVRISATSGGPTVASTIQYLFRNIACDNDTTSGIDVAVSAPFTEGVDPATDVVIDN